MEPPRLQAAPVPVRRASTAVAPALARAALHGGRGEVVGVYGRAMTVRFGSLLVTVAGERLGGLPVGLVVDDAWSPRAGGVAVGLRATTDGVVLRAGPLEFNLRGVATWSPHLPVHPIPIDLAAERAAAVRSAVEARGPSPTRPSSRRRPTGPGLLLHDGLTDRVAGLGDALRRGAPADIAACGDRLIGFGPGLTPSGDDVLVGLTGALTALGDQRAGRLARAWSARAAAATTDVACGFHAAAARGDYAERLHVALAGILGGPVGRIPAVVEAAAAWGATSGLDTLIGVSLALDAAADARALTSADAPALTSAPARRPA